MSKWYFLVATAAILTGGAWLFVRRSRSPKDDYMEPAALDRINTEYS